MDCQQEVAAEQWSSLTGQIQSNLMNYMAQYDEKARADRLLCTKMRDVYGPLKFEKPASLECFYQTAQNTVDCGDADQYDKKCETGEEIIYSTPKDEVDGQRVPNIVILGEY